MRQSGSSSPARAISGKRRVQSSPFRVRSVAVPLGDAHLHPVAVELDLVAPARIRRRKRHETRELGRDELRR